MKTKTWHNWALVFMFVVVMAVRFAMPAGLAKPFVSIALAVVFLIFIWWIGRKDTPADKMTTAILTDEKGRLESLLKKYPEWVNARDDDDGSPLSTAVLFDKPKMAQVLIEHGADVNARGITGPFLHMALVFERKRIFDLMLENGADVNAPGDLGTILHVAVLKHDLQAMGKLLDRGADVNARNSEGNTPLHLVASIEDQDKAIEIMGFLVQRGASIDTRNTVGETPLDAAARLKRDKVVEYLRSQSVAQ